MEEEKRKNVSEKQETHGEFLDTLGEGISGDYKRIIDLVAAIKNINRIEEKSFSKSNIGEDTKDKRIRQILESYDVVEEFENVEAEEIAEENEEATQVTDEIPEKNEIVSQDENVVEENENVEPLDKDAEKAKQRALRLAEYEEKKKRYTMNNEKTLENLSKNIESLLGKVQAAKKENAKGKKRGQNFEKENIYYDDVIYNLKKHRRYVKDRMKQVEKNKESQELNDNMDAVILDGGEAEPSIFEPISDLDEEIEPVIIKASELEQETEIETSHFEPAPEEEQETETSHFEPAPEEEQETETSHFEPVSEEEQETEPVVIPTPAQEYEAEKSHFELAPEEEQKEKTVARVVARKKYGKVSEGQHIWIKDKDEDKDEYKDKDEDKEENPSLDFEWTYSEGEENAQPIYDEMIYSEGEGNVELADVEQEQNQTVQPEPEQEQNQTVQPEPEHELENEPAQASEPVVVVEKQDNSEKQTEPEKQPTAQATQAKSVNNQKSPHTVQYIQVPVQTVVQQQEPKDVIDGENQANQQDGENAQNHVEPVTEHTPSEKEPNTAQNETGDTMQQLDNWAGAIIAGANNGKKVEDILKGNTSTNSIVEKIEKGELNINDAKKALSKKLRESGKSDEKLIAAVEKYLVQRTNSGKMYVTITGTMVPKENLWKKIVNAFKGFGVKVKNFFSKEKAKDVEKAEKTNDDSVNSFKARLHQPTVVKLHGQNVLVNNVTVGKLKNTGKALEEQSETTNSGNEEVATVVQKEPEEK